MTARDLPAPADFADAVRAAIAACHALDIRATAERLAADGLTGVLCSEQAGGMDLPFEYAVPLLSAAGSSLLTFPLLETLLASKLLQTSLPAVAESIVSGNSLVTIAWTGTVDVVELNGALQVSGSVGNASRAADCAYTIMRVSGGGAIFVPLDGEGAEVSVVDGLDFDRPVYQIHLDAVSVPLNYRVDAGQWQNAEADAWLGFAAMLLGGAQTCLDMAQEHANTRVQFGKALSANQAMRHLLARQKMQIDGIRNVLDSCFLVEGTADLARRKSAFVAASESGVAIVEKAIQIHGGMGFTWEVPLHRYLRWARALQFQGDADSVLLSLADMAIGPQTGRAA